MKIDVTKIITKTAAITAGILIFLFTALAAVTAWINPAFAADLSNRAGLSFISIPLSVSAYERSKDINDLGTLIERSVAAKNDKVTAKYGETLLKYENFQQFCDYKDNLEEGNYRTYIRGNLAASYYRLKEYEKVLEIVAEDISQSYPVKSSMDYLVFAFAGRPDDDFKQDLIHLISPKFTQFFENYSENNADLASKTQAKSACMHLYQIYVATGEAEQAEIYENHYNTALK